ncbi:MAG TPA: ester cyclase [Terriglobia bacterium]|nr:ester cyclase [Terriglobia bacterium]
MTVESNLALVSRIWDEVWNQGNLNTVNEVLSTLYVGHLPATNGVRGPEEFKQLITTYRTAFPDVHLTVEDLFGQGDRVVARWISRGTHHGAFAGIAPTGRRIEIMGISIFRLADGKVQEEWEGFDTLALMQQLGAAPAAASGQR